MIVLMCAMLLPACAGAQVDRYNTVRQQAGAYFDSVYPDLFVELAGVRPAEVRAKIDSAFQQLFYGDDSTERVYYSVGDADMAYIIDVANKDVRTEGMSYGMMIAVQLNKKEEFDRLWRWAKTHMQFCRRTAQRVFRMALHDRRNPVGFHGCIGWRRVVCDCVVLCFRTLGRRRGDLCLPA